MTGLGFCNTQYIKTNTFFSNDKKVIDIDKYKHDNESKYPVFKNGKLLLCVIQEEFIHFQNEITKFCERNANDHKICKCIYNLRAYS